MIIYTQPFLTFALLLLSGLTAAQAYARALSPAGAGQSFLPAPARLASASDSDEGLTPAMIELLDRYAPVIMLASNERFFPSSIDYMLPHYRLLDDQGVDFLGEEAVYPLNSTGLGNLTSTVGDSGRGLFLAVNSGNNDDAVNAQLVNDFLDDRPDAHYLMGPGEGQRALERRMTGVWERNASAARPTVDAPVYGFHVSKGQGVVDLLYWTYYPYNLGKSVGPFGWLGNHIGDWEHLRLRTINGEAVSADYGAHTGSIGTGTLRWIDVPKTPDGRPIAYSAAGSHGLWDSPGVHTFGGVLGGVIKLQDETDDEGAVWDTKGRVVAAQWWQDSSAMDHRRRYDSMGPRGWLNYRGFWGNKGDKRCWWDSLVDICAMVDGPYGPNRNFASPPRCTIAPLRTSGQSLYNFTLHATALQFAAEQGLTHVEVEQGCGLTKLGSHGDDDGEMEEAARSKRRRIPLERGEGGRFEIGVPPCSGLGRPHITFYRLALTTSDGNRKSRSPKRKVCTYDPSAKGYTNAPAAEVWDPDIWQWSY